MSIQNAALKSSPIPNLFPYAKVTFLLPQRILHTQHFLILSQNIRHRPDRRNSKLINLPMTLRIMILNMFELRRILESRDIPIQMPEPLMQVRVPRTNISDIGFEVLDVDRVKADDSCVKPDVSFRYGGG